MLLRKKSGKQSRRIWSTVLQSGSGCRKAQPTPTFTGVLL
jgi:hypothetical protein